MGQLFHSRNEPSGPVEWVSRNLKSFRPASGTSFDLNVDPASMQRRMVLDLATRRSDELMEVQVLYLVACIIGLHVTSPIAIAIGYIAIQLSELHGMLLIRKIFLAARNPSDTLQRFAGAVLRYELLSAMAISLALAIGMLFAIPDWKLGVVAMWCIAIVYFVFPTFYCVQSMYGVTIVQCGTMLITFVVDHMIADAGRMDLLFANVGVCVFSGASAAFIGRQLRAEYIRRLERERDLAGTVRDLNRQNALKTDFVGHLSHELRTPLNGIMGTAALLRQTAVTTDQRDKLDVMLKSGAKLVQVLNDSLDLSRLEANSVRLDISANSLRSLVEEQISLFQASAREKALTLECDMDPAMPDLLLIDSHRSMQVLGNLIANAIKFSEGGTIRVVASFETDDPIPQMRISVADHGIGIAPEALDLIFDPYEQADISTARQFPGAGLGLAIARRLAYLMGGDLTVQSSPGQGSVFVFTFVAMPA